MSQIKTGLTSVTFRQKSPEEIVKLAAKAGLQGIEWGGDIHVPAGDKNAAETAAALTHAAGLEVFSYGSYYHGLEGEDFSPVLESAKALGAPLIRVWAGNQPYETLDPAQREALADRFRQAADMAAQEQIQIGFEYHRDTATQTIEGAMALLKAVGRPNVQCYWQPNPDISQEQRKTELGTLLPYLAHIHVFAWTKGNVRHPLSQGEPHWKEYLSLLPKPCLSHYLILEFVQDDSELSFFQDAETLHSWTVQLGL